MTTRSSYFFDALKAATLLLLGLLLLFLGTPKHHTSVGAYLAFFAILLLQGIEIFFPRMSDSVAAGRRTLLLRVSILLQLSLASFLVALTDGSGSIYELVYLLPIVSAAAKLPGRDVAFAVTGAIVAMVGFIVTGEELTSSISRVKEFQDAVAAIVYFTMAGILTYLFARDERARRMHYQELAGQLEASNAALRQAQVELSERLTQLSQMEERIQRFSQMAALGEMAGQIAHEVRNPLGIIQGASDMLTARVTDPAVQRHLSVLKEEVEHLKKAVDGILRLGGSLGIERRSVDLRELLRSVEQSVTSSVTARPTVTFHIPNVPVRVVGDAQLLHHACVNLIRNGIQALGAGGAVSVTVERRRSQEAAIEIMDTGKGMSPDDLRRLGESFFTRRAGGVGLGFALARKIVQEHGGRLEVVSRERAGTTVTVLIPIESVHQTAHPEMPAAGVMRG